MLPPRPPSLGPPLRSDICVDWAAIVGKDGLWAEERVDNTCVGRSEPATALVDLSIAQRKFAALEPSSPTWNAMVGRQDPRRRPRAMLVHLHEGTLIAEVPLTKPETEFGRDREAGIPLLSARASRRHARLFRRRGDWVVEDLRSRHGTLLNGVRVHSASLKEGDILQFGDDLFAYSLA